MNRTTSAFWTATAFAVTMIINLSPAFASWGRQTVQSVCPDPSRVNIAQEICKNPVVAQACASVCVQVQVNCTVNCGTPSAPSAPAATTATPAKKSVQYRPRQMECLGGAVGKDGRCECPPEKVTENGAEKEIPRVAVVAKPTQFRVVGVAGDVTWYQGTDTYQCVSTGDATAIINTRLNGHEKRIKKLEQEAEQQGFVNEAVRQQFVALYAEVAKIRGLALDTKLNIQRIDVEMSALDKMYKRLSDRIESTEKFVPRLDLAYALGVMFRGSDAGSGVMHHLVFGYTQTFDDSAINLWAQGRAGFLSCDGCDPRTAGKATLYTGGGAAGLGIGLGDNREFSLRGGLFVQLVAAPDSLNENGMGRQIGGEFQVRYDIPSAPVFIAGVGDLALYNKSNFFGRAGEPPSNINAGADRSMGGALMFMVGLSPRLPFIGSL